MARLIGGIGVSHIPLLGRVIDSEETRSERWREIFDGFERGQTWMRVNRPDVVIVVYNDHGAGVSFDMLPTFAIGLAPIFPIAGEVRGPRQIPAVPGHPEFAWHLAEHLTSNEFDLALAQDLSVDHGLTVPLSMLWGRPEEWPVPVVPIAVNVVLQPTPSARRCFDLGRSIGKAVQSFAPDLRVAIVGTGGMSHQLQGARAGFINQEFDRRFLDSIGPNPADLTALSVRDYISLAGSEGSELVMWLVMRGALPPNARTVYSYYHAPISSTGGGLVVLEP